MWILSVLGVLAMAYGGYRRASAMGSWALKLFAGILGAVVAFVGLFLVPLMRSNWKETHVGLTVGLMLSGGLVFAGGVILVARKVSMGK